MKYIQLLGSTFLLTVLMGCSLIPPSVEITPQPFDVNSSYAFNIANQTALTKPYYYGKTYSSPLKDFSQEDKDKAVEAFNKESNAGSMLGLAVVTAVSGDPMLGLGGIGASGLIAITHSKHIASKPTWIIAVEKSQFESKAEAQKFIIKSIKTAMITEVEKYGEVKIEQPNKNFPNWNQLLVKIDEEWVPAGFGFQSENVTAELLTERKVLLNGTEVEAYTYGYGTEIDNLRTTLATAPNPYLIYKKVGDDAEFDHVIHRLTQQLPLGFNLYYPPYPKVQFEPGKYYINIKNPLPTIYTQGNKYEFIKP